MRRHGSSVQVLHEVLAGPPSTSIQGPWLVARTSQVGREISSDNTLSRLDHPGQHAETALEHAALVVRCRPSHGGHWWHFDGGGRHSQMYPR